MRFFYGLASEEFSEARLLLKDAGIAAYAGLGFSVLDRVLKVIVRVIDELRTTV